METKSGSKDQNVFISYAREDKISALRLFDDLKKRGANPWIDLKNLLPGENWEQAIVDAIEKSDFFIALLSSESVEKRGFVQKEIKKALGVLDLFPEGEKYLIPARLNDCRPTHHRLKELHWVDMFPSWSNGLDRILLALEIDPHNFKEINEIENIQIKRKKNIFSRRGKKEYKRFQFDFSPKAATRLDKLVEQTGSTSKAEVIRASLRLYDYLVNEKQRGSRVMINRDDKNIEIAFPSS